MEEDIDFIKYYMKQYFSEDIAIEDDFKFEKAIENLLKRYKELEEENKNARNEIIKIINTPEAIKNSINELRTNQFIGENVKLVILNYIDKIKTENEQYKKQFEDLKNNILVPGITEKNYITTSVIQKKIDKTKFYIPEYQGEFVAIEDLQEILEEGRK